MRKVFSKNKNTISKGFLDFTIVKNNIENEAVKNNWNNLDK